MINTSLGAIVSAQKLAPESGGGEGFSSLQSIVSSCVCDFDANVAETFDNLSGASFDGWLNLVASPADGASQSDYDLQNGDGAGADEMIFGGIIGDGAYIEVNNDGDYLTQTSAKTSTPMWASMHRTDQGHGYTIALAIRFEPAEGLDPIMGTSYSGGETGIQFQLDGGERIDVINYISGGSNNGCGNINDGILASSTDYLFVFTWNADTGTFVTYQNGVKVTSTGLFPNAIEDVAAQVFRLGVNLDATTKIYHLSCYNSFITDTDAANIKSEIESRSGLTF